MGIPKGHEETFEEMDITTILIVVTFHKYIYVKIDQTVCTLNTF